LLFKQSSERALAALHGGGCMRSHLPTVMGIEEGTLRICHDEDHHEREDSVSRNMVLSNVCIGTNNIIAELGHETDERRWILFHV
jgi:hypothetical protein